MTFWSLVDEVGLSIARAGEPWVQARKREVCDLGSIPARAGEPPARGPGAAVTEAGLSPRVRQAPGAHRERVGGPRGLSPRVRGNLAFTPARQLRQ